MQYLIQVKKYPATLIAMEKVIRLGELKKRFDILVYDTNHRPWMMIECKAPAIKLDEAVLHQLLRYHISVPTGSYYYAMESILMDGKRRREFAAYPGIT